MKKPGPMKPKMARDKQMDAIKGKAAGRKGKPFPPKAKK